MTRMGNGPVSRTITMSKNPPSIQLSGFTLSADFSEFKRKAHFVPVIARRNTSERVSWRCQDNYEQPDSFGALRQFVFLCLRQFEAANGTPMPEAEAKAWVDESVQRFLDPDHVRIDGVYYAIGPDNHVLIIYRDDNGPLAGISRETILGLVWHVENDEAHA